MLEQEKIPWAFIPVLFKQCPSEGRMTGQWGKGGQWVTLSVPHSAPSWAVLLPVISFFIFIFFPSHHTACRSPVPWPGTEPRSLQWEPGILTTRLPGNSLAPCSWSKISTEKEIALIKLLKSKQLLITPYYITCYSPKEWKGAGNVPRPHGWNEQKASLRHMGLWVRQPWVLSWILFKIFIGV